MDPVTASPFLIDRCGSGMYPTGHPSVMMKSGVTGNCRSTRRSRNLFDLCSPRRSIRVGVARQTDTATACSTMRP